MDRIIAIFAVALMLAASGARADGEPPAPRVKAGNAASATKHSAPRPRAARKAAPSAQVAVVHVVTVSQFPSPRFNDMMTAVLYRDRETVNQLLDMGRWVDKPDSAGVTPLMASVMDRNPEMTQLLLARGANPNLQAPGGRSAMRLAHLNGDGATVAMLETSGARQ